MSAERSTQRTYSLLEPRLSQPTEYEIVTSRLHSYVGRGFEVEVPLQRWYQAHQTGSALRCEDWEAFQDPRQTTYTAYTRMQSAGEAVIAACGSAHEAGGRDALLPPSSVAALAGLLGPMRFVVHGFHMVIAYVGHMAPSGRITLCALFQAADELRRIEHVAYRLRGLLARDSALLDGRQAWQAQDGWQPTRQLVERLLVTYDWGEAYAALTLCVKPVLDAALHRALRVEAERAQDAWLLAAVHAFEDDAAWQRAWAVALARHVLEQNPAAKDVLQAFIDRFWPRALHAVAALPIAALPAAAGNGARREAWDAHVAELRALDLRVPGAEGRT